MRFSTMIEGVIIQLGNKAKGLLLDNVDKSAKLIHDRGGLLTIETTGGLDTLGITLAASD